MTSDQEDRDWQRLDKWLWCARFLKARSDCTRLAAEGLIRINRQPTDKAHARLRVGDVLTFPLRGQVRVVRVLSLAVRRGPAIEARTLYDEIVEPPSDAPLRHPRAPSSPRKRGPSGRPSPTTVAADQAPPEAR